MNYGWICPKCGSVYSPSTVECYKCNPTNKTLTSTNVAIKDYEQWLNSIKHQPAEQLKEES